MKKMMMAATMAVSMMQAQAMERPLWLRYPAISPDGQKVAFCYQGNLYVVAASGGEARQLTTNAAYESMPVWSPDSKTIAFCSRREGSKDIYTISADGGVAKRITSESGSELPLAFKDNETIIYQAQMMPTVESIVYPGSFSQTYEVGTSGYDRPRLYSEIMMEDVDVNEAGDVLYHNNKGYEDMYRKHHTSPVARDIMLKTQTGFKQLSDFQGENRTPRWAQDGRSYFYLSEENGTFNVWKRNIDGTGKQRLTSFERNPVRALTVSRGNKACFWWDGEIYTMEQGAQPQRLNVEIRSDQNARELVRQLRTAGATEIAVSPKQKEVAFVMHGDVYVTAIDYRTTRRITDTPQQERDLTFAPDGRAIAYAAERTAGVWQIYETRLKNKDEKTFTYSTDLEERQIVKTGVTSQYPQYSPDGKKIAYYENRGTLMVADVKSGEAKVCMDGKNLYSYSDGDIGFKWSPDSRWLLTSYMGGGGWNSEDLALVKADGSGELHNITNSGYNNSGGEWVLDGKAIIYGSDRDGYRNHGSWGTHKDVYIMFFDLEAYEKFMRTKEETAVVEIYGDKKEIKAAEKEEEKKDEKKKEEEKKVKPLLLDIENCKDRVVRLTVNSSRLGGYALSKKGDVLYYKSIFEGGYDLWKHDLKENKTELIYKGIGGGGLEWDAAKENLYLCGSGIKKYNVGSRKMETIAFDAEFNYKQFEERRYLFDHVWQQVKDKFYDTEMHGVDWEYYRQTYEKFLPHITNNDDFADMLSELLGELNASHTGAGYRHTGTAASTAQLGLFFDETYTGEGLKVKEVLKRGPFAVRETGVKPGSIITAIDGEKIEAGKTYWHMLAGKTGKRVRISVKGEKDVIVKPISKARQTELLYKRWVERNRHLVDSLSGGQLAYVHVKAMNSESFRVAFDELLSEKNRNRKAVIVDERHNGGGWLHDDLCTLLSGKEYQQFVPHGQYVGRDPWNKWTKPSCVLVCENDYSNGHGFPSVYKALGIGKVIGAPVAGTMTAVWWETLMDPSLYFGIPQVGCRDMDGKFAENNTLQPDITVYNTPEDYINGYDRQLIRAVEEMMRVKN